MNNPAGSGTRGGQVQAAVTVLLSLGSNVEPERHLRVALEELRARFGALTVSPAYRTAAVGFDGAPFINNAVMLQSDDTLVALEAWLHAYIEGAQLTDSKGYLFRTVVGRTGQLSERPMTQADAFRMVGRRADAAGIRTHIGCHSFRATGITEYLLNGGKLEIAQQMANHESSRTTGLYDRRGDQIKLDEVERIGI